MFYVPYVGTFFAFFKQGCGAFYISLCPCKYWHVIRFLFLLLSLMQIPSFSIKYIFVTQKFVLYWIYVTSYIYTQTTLCFQMHFLFIFIYLLFQKKWSKYIFLKNNKSYYTYLYIWCLFLPLLFEQRVPPMDENVVSSRIVPNDWSYWHQHEQDSYAEDRKRRFGHF